MIVVTSLSPGHANRLLQLDAVNSWQTIGDCYSLNCEHEIGLLLNEGYKGVVFIPNDRTIEYFAGKPLASINAIIDFAKSLNEDLLLINSDIILTDLPELKQDGITIFSRYDYKETFEDCSMFEAGFDVAYIPKHFLNIFPPSIYGLGMAWWDYWLPYHILIKNIPIYWPQGKHAFHKLHPIQYDFKQWEFIADHFRWEFKMPKQMTGGQIATLSLQKIRNYITKY